MSLSWRQRKTRLCSLVNSRGGENVDGTAVDRLMHGQSVIGRTTKTAEIDELRFQDKDLQVAGTLEYGQFGVIDIVTCRLDNRVYARKSIEKSFALRTREQCSPQTERDVLLRATLTNSPWAPHLLAAYQMPTHLHLVMDYAEGGTLWDVLESSPLDGRVSESDLRWWAPQAVSAIHWCHSQGFAHRDIKPHNFVLTKDAHILLIDFGSAAPLLLPGPDGSQRLAKEYCLVPCGTCDYISPEILKSHEEALVALEMKDEDAISLVKEVEDAEGYGLETDWWSLGAMLYEMIYGVAPFFANEIRHTYQRIMNHKKSLKFPSQADVSAALRDLLRGLLTDAEKRLGRLNVSQITDHPLFEDIDWANLGSEPAPDTLHLPQFTYNEPKASSVEASQIHPQLQSQEGYSQGFAFSALFQSSRGSATPALRSSRGSVASPALKSARDFDSPALSFLRSTTTPHRSSSRDDPSSAFIGFSWGPRLDAFPDESPNTAETSPFASLATKTPKPLRTPSTLSATAWNTLPVTSSNGFLTPGYPRVVSTPGPNPLHYMTPVRAFSYSPGTTTGMDTIRRTSTLRRTAPRRTVSDREAMKQLVEAVGMSARKKVLESGRKPRILTSFSMRTNDLSERFSAAAADTNTEPRPKSTGTTTNGGTVRKELRFFPTPTAIPASEYNSSFYTDASLVPKGRLAPLDLDPYSRPVTRVGHYQDGRAGYCSASDGEGTESEGPPSPSPTPRPGSAMSRRSGTPTLSAMSTGTGILSGRRRSGSGSSMGGLLAPWSANGFSASGAVASSGRMRSNSGSGFPSISASGSVDALSASATGISLGYAAGLRPSAGQRGRAPSGLKKMSASFVSVSIADDSDRDAYTSESESEKDSSLDGDGDRTEIDREEERTEIDAEEDRTRMLVRAEDGGEDEDQERERSEEQKEETYRHEPRNLEEEDSSRSLTSYTSLASNRLLDDLSKRHSRMMLDIGTLEERLEQISRNVWGRYR